LSSIKPVANRRLLQSKKALDKYHFQIQQNSVKRSWKHWYQMYTNHFYSPLLKTTFKQCFASYAPCTLGQAHVRGVWLKKPTCMQRHEYRPRVIDKTLLLSRRPRTSTPRPTTPCPGYRPTSPITALAHQRHVPMRCTPMG